MNADGHRYEEQMGMRVNTEDGEERWMNTDGHGWEGRVGWGGGVQPEPNGGV